MTPEMQIDLRTRGLDDGRAGLTRCEQHITERIGAAPVISDDQRADHTTAMKALETKGHRNGTEVRLVRQTVKRSVLTPPVLVWLIVGFCLADWGGLIQVMADAAVAPRGRLILSLIVTVCLVFLTGQVWNRVFDGRRGSRSRGWSAMAPWLAWSALVGAIATIRYMRIDNADLGVIPRIAIVLMALAMTVGPAIAAAWACWEHEQQYSTWKELQRVLADGEQIAEDLAAERGTWAARLAEVVHRDAERKEGEASYTIGNMLGLAEYNASRAPAAEVEEAVELET